MILPLIISEVAPAKIPYSPFQNTSNLAEYALARLDDLLNWGRKVTYPGFVYVSVSFQLAVDVFVTL
jgi:hypothetical protein